MNGTATAKVCRRALRFITTSDLSRVASITLRFAPRRPCRCDACRGVDTRGQA